VKYFNHVSKLFLRVLVNSRYILIPNNLDFIKKTKNNVTVLSLYKNDSKNFYNLLIEKCFKTVFIFLLEKTYSFFLYLFAFFV
jgi:hypothetical protein